MNRERPALIMALILLVHCAGWAAAEEPAKSFLDALRDRGYYDIALDYLTTAEKNPAVPASFKEILVYEKAATLIQGAHLERDPATRERQLDEAQQALSRFVKVQPEHLFAMAARNQLGNVMMERARSRVQRTKNMASAEQQPLLKQARDLYTEGGKVFTTLADELRTKLKTYPAALDEKTDAQKIEERDRYRQDFLQAQLFAAIAREEMADTMPANSKERTQALNTAAEEYKKFHENYRTRAAGWYARMYQGRCMQKLGKDKDASALFDEVLTQDSTDDAFRAIVLKAMALAVESWMQQQRFAVILDRAGKMIESARPTEERSDEIMTLRFYVAKAAKSYADQLKAKNPRDPDIRKHLAEGRKYATYLTRVTGAHQEAARRLLIDFTGGDAEPMARAEPKSFADAKNAAKDAIDAVQLANLLVRNLPGRLSSAKSPEQEQLQKQLDDAKQQVTRGQAEARQYCRLALQLAGNDTEIADLNLVRYLLCYLLYSDKSYFDAVVLGEFLARRYPDSPHARACAKIALAGYVNLHTESDADDKSFEEQKVVSLGDYIVSKWPDQPEADEAFNTLIPFMIRAGKLRQAQDYLGKIPTDSPQRSSAELKTGQALWASYLDSSKQIRNWESGFESPPDGTDLAARKQELDELKSKARQTLQAGIDRMRKNSEVSRALLTAVLSLAQICVDTSEPGKAVELLEDTKIGPLTLVEKNDPAAVDDVVAEETYKTALRAYISSLGAGSDAKATIGKARKIMEALKKRAGDNSQGPQRLVGVYVALARDLQRQMEIAEAVTKKTLGEGFETFLTEVAADATELNVMNWVGDTYLGMGEAFGGGAKAVTPQAKGYFVNAIETYQKILEKGKSDQDFLPPQMAAAVQIKLARAKKGTGDYIAAMNILEQILKATPTMLPAQIEAARIYQEWGGMGKGQHENYVRAIVGARPDKAKNNRNTIWGWGEIARMTANNAQFKEQFYDARYNLALCRYQFAVAQDNAEKKKEQLQRAKSDIALTAGLYPELGGDEKKKQFDGLLRNIQKAIGESAEGLRGLQTPALTRTGK